MKSVVNMIKRKLKLKGRSFYYTHSANMHMPKGVLVFSRTLICSFWFFPLIILLGMYSCNEKNQITSTPLFELMAVNHTQIDFLNNLSFDNNFNIYKYRNFYNGGGVGLGDINNDGLLDIYFTANLLPNKLYLNKGDFVFEDITEMANVGGSRGWSTGVSMVDINADGWLDIYVCNSGSIDGDNKQNEFFINNKDNTFTEMGSAMGLDDGGYSTHSSFFDYDKDGDLDVYLLNNSFKSIGSFNSKNKLREKRDVMGGDKLLRNDNGIFTDVSEKAGIFGSEIGFGLGVATSDLNMDGWMDIYVCNDFFERDYIYMNNGDGTFSEELEDVMNTISHSSMGCDATDITGDGFPEIFVTEMLPEGENRLKTTMTFQNWDKYSVEVQNGYHHQFTRNMMHLNNGTMTDSTISFSEIARLTGVEATDWSWSPLFADFDNNGFQDLYITNGITQDILNQDYINYIANESVVRTIVLQNGVDYKKLIELIPSNKIPNYMYSGQDYLQFNNMTENWGLSEPSHSNGAAYGDLDNDGDLDLVVNNLNMAPFIYRNASSQLLPNNNYLVIKLRGKGENLDAIGAKVAVKAGMRTLFKEQSPSRGFQSSIDRKLHFGLGNINLVDTLIVEWTNGKRTQLTNVEANQTVLIEEASDTLNNMKFVTRTKKNDVMLSNITSKVDLDYTHIENDYVDFNRDRLLFHMRSNEGPRIAVADINDDGLEDFFIGGSKGTSGSLFIQQISGGFLQSKQEVFTKDKDSEDASSLFLDVDGDLDLDLYVSSGGTEFSMNSYALLDRLYINDGKGNFSRSNQLLPNGEPESTSVVKAVDFDDDGDLDLFVGVRLNPNTIGISQNGYILENDGTGSFTNVTPKIAPGLIDVGMITDVLWTDYDADNDMDLIVVGEWMSIKIFNYNEGKFFEKTEELGLKYTSGWWNSIEPGDLDGDGDIDYVLGNHGLNTRFYASIEKPMSLAINDFDRNGSIEQVFLMYNGDKSYPVALLHDLVGQIPEVRKKILKYESYKGKQMNEIFDKDQLNGTIYKTISMLESVVLINEKGSFHVKPLPSKAQFSPIYAIFIKDFDNDGIQDLILGGNQFRVKPEAGRYDASYGTFLKGMGNCNYKVLSAKESGVFIKGEVRDIQPIQIKGKDALLVSKNNSKLQVLNY